MSNISSARDAIGSIFLFNIVSALPWPALLACGKSFPGDEGPGIFGLLLGAGIGTIFVLPFYSGGLFLASICHVHRLVKWLAGMLLLVVVLFCLGLSYLWGEVGVVREAPLFILAALAYAAFAIKLIWQICLFLKAERQSPVAE